MGSGEQQFEVFFDGGCPLCRREIDMIRGKDKSQQLILTDISSPNFQCDDHSLKTLMEEIHGRRADGSYVKGVEVFREIYDRLGYMRLVSVTRLPIVRHSLNWIYRVFAKLRFMHASHRMKKCSQDGVGAECGGESCEFSGRNPQT